MKVFVPGANGQLGQALLETMPDGIDVIGSDLPVLDITNYEKLLTSLVEVNPTVIINAAAYTAVDLAESEARLATVVNADGAGNVARAAESIGARLIHISTDFVFDGNTSVPYKTDDPTNPLSVYGQTKRDGEIAVLRALPDDSVVLRTAWLYGRTGSNFVKTMLRLMRERDELEVVTDQVGTPTWAKSLAMAIWAFVAAPELGGIFHWTDAGQASWFEFALAIQQEADSLGLLDKRIPVRAISSADYATAAARPKYSVLDCSASCSALGLRRVDWRVNLRNMLSELKT